MNIRWQTAAAACLLAILAGRPSAAETGEARLGFSAGAGYRYDGNVGLTDIDASTGQGDGAWVTDLGVDASLPFGKRLSADLGYSYSATRYREFSEYDLAIHRLRGALGYRFAGFDSALSVDRFKARLDDDAFLDMTRLSPSLSRMFGDRLYLRGAWARSEKSYEDRSGRDALNEAVRGDAYWLIDGMQRYLSLTIERDREDAASDALDYEGISTRVAYGHRLEAGPLAADLRTHLQLEHRDYAVGEAGEAPRRDERLLAGLGIALPFSQHLELTALAEHADNASTLETAAYDEMVYTVSVNLEL